MTLIFSNKDINRLYELIVSDVSRIIEWLNENQLVLNEDKSRYDNLIEK
jgi:hypothetical protein